MTTDDHTVTFDQLTELGAEAPTLVEGLPGQGLVAAIAADVVTRQLSLEHHGNVISDEFPRATSFKNGRVRDLVRVYAGADPPVMTLQSDVALPGSAFEALGRCVLEDLAPEFERAIFLAGIAAPSEEEIGDVFGVTTTDEEEARLRDVGVELVDGPGLIGGVTGALVIDCYHADVPATVLVVKANPYLPDPTAARSVIENALEPLVDFDIDTTELDEQADRIKRQMEQLAKHYRQTVETRRPKTDETELAMYQ